MMRNIVPRTTGNLSSRKFLKVGKMSPKKKLLQVVQTKYLRNVTPFFCTHKVSLLGGSLQGHMIPLACFPIPHPTRTGGCHQILEIILFPPLLVHLQIYSQEQPPSLAKQHRHPSSKKRKSPLFLPSIHDTPLHPRHPIKPAFRYSSTGPPKGLYSQIH